MFSGVGKTREEMQAALSKAGILLFNVESESELWVLAECAARLHKVARIALRVNPDVPANTHPYISTGLQKHKFGVPIAEARTLYAKASGTRHLKVAGVSVHIGSQITDMDPFAATMERVAELVSVNCATMDTRSISWMPAAAWASRTKIEKGDVPSAPRRATTHRPPALKCSPSMLAGMRRPCSGRCED